MSGFVESVRYEADISQIMEKLDTLKRELGDVEEESTEATDGAGGGWDRFKDKLGKAGGALKLAGGAIAGVAGVAAIFGPQILGAGVELEAMDKKSKTVFSGGSLSTVKSWADGVASSLGLTKAQAVGVAAGIGDLLKPMGFSADQAAGMSTKLVDLSGALSAWTGGTKDAQEVSDILTKALLGETDGLKSLGISISAADVQARLAKNGQDDLTGTALEQAKALATQQLIMEKSTDAQKAWSDGSMDSVKAQNAAKAAQAQLSESINRLLYPALKAILPPLTKAVEWLAENLPPAIKIAKEWFEKHLLPTIEKVGAFFGKLVGWVQKHWDQISSTISTTINTIKAVIAKVTAVIQEIWDRWGDKIVAAIKFAWDTISAIVKFAIDTVKAIIHTVTALIKGDWEEVWNGIKEFFKAIWDAIKAVVQLQIDAIKLIISTAWEAVKQVFETVWAAIKLVFTGIWDAMKAALQLAVDAMKETVRLAWEGIKELFTGAVDFITGLPGKFLDAAKKVGTAIWDGIKEGLGVIADKVWMFLQGVIDKAPEWAGKIFTAVQQIGSKLWDGIKEGVGNIIGKVWGWIQDLIAAIPDMAKDMFDGAVKIGKGFIDGIVDGVKDIANKGLDVAKSFANAIIGFINSKIIDGINNLLEFTIPVPFFDDIHIDPPDIPHIPTFHTGGTVPGSSSGPDVLALLRPRETVRTEAQERALRGSSSTLNGVSFVLSPGAIVVHAGPGADGRLIGRQIVDELSQFTRHNGNAWLTRLSA